MSKIKFSDGMPKRERRSSTSIYPEELLDKKCGGCMRCQSRKRKGETVCCICCEKQGGCDNRCDMMDSYEYAEDCEDYIKEDE